MKQEILEKLPKHGEFRFFFYKKDGTVREAYATLDPVVISEFWQPKGGGYEEAEDVIRYFDLEALSWRSFKVENFIDLCLIST